ncbi:hypothetical protein CTI12_AA266390 [Artemisia annua]|uniref:Uncharacterized protein n=1 Tax=Artemisia annua TaxID=35608 RepID=A0A2U1NH18_ARTAN|nr:hypothetical protein CTI12_AA266390 [Artemisia annua]
MGGSCKFGHTSCWVEVLGASVSSTVTCSQDLTRSGCVGNRHMRSMEQPLACPTTFRFLERMVNAVNQLRGHHHRIRTRKLVIIGSTISSDAILLKSENVFDISVSSYDIRESLIWNLISFLTLSKMAATGSSNLISKDTGKMVVRQGENISIRGLKPTPRSKIIEATKYWKWVTRNVSQPERIGFCSMLLYRQVSGFVLAVAQT